MPSASATTFPASEDFESSDGIGPNPRIIGDWIFSLLKDDGTLDDSDNSNNDIDDFYENDKGLGMSGAPDIVKTASIKSTKGSFKLLSLRLENVPGNSVELKIEGYRNNIFVAGAVQINQYTSGVKVDMPLVGEEWQNIDEFRISRTDGVADIFVRIYDIAVGPPVTILEDTLSPTITNSSMNITNINNGSATLNWTKAADNITDTENLEYQVYQSASNNIDTVNNIEANGSVIGNYTKDIATFDISGLLPNIDYYFNVIVKDGAGNKTVYTTIHVMIPNVYTVSFDVAGGSAVSSQPIAHGNKATEPTPAPTKVGHTFGGWYTTNGYITPFDFNTTITGNTTIYAKWTPVEYTVSFEVDGGSAVSSQPVAHGNKATEPTPAPTKAGHTFGGWYTTNGHAIPFDFNTTITGNTTIYAKWTPVEYTVSFEVDGGSAVSSQTVAHGNKTTEPTPAPTKVGHTFGGWYTTNGHAIPFDFNTTITGNTTIYAKWTPVEYTVSFEVDGGSAVSNQTVVHGNRAIQPDPVPTKIGYLFEGWYTDDTHTIPFDFNTVIIENTILYAKWLHTPVMNTVSFEVNGGSPMPNQSVVHGNKVAEPIPVPTKAGYIFNGWYINSALTQIFNSNTLITADITLYAKWTAIVSPPSDNASNNDDTNLNTNNTANNSTSEQFLVDVQSGDGNDMSKTIIYRTTNLDGTVQDRVTLTVQSATEALVKLQDKQSDTMRIVLPTDTANRVQQTDIVVAQNVLMLLKESRVQLEIAAGGAKIAIPQSSLQAFNQELYFRVVPVKTEEEQRLEERAKIEQRVQQVANGATVTLLGHPMTIETNMQNHRVTLTLPLPQNVTQEQLDNLAAYIEHSDGTKEVVRGQVVDFKAGTKGIQFEVTKFSTFSVLYVPVKKEQPKEEVLVAEPISTPYIKGYADGTFRPEASVTRAQMASMMARYVTDNEIPEATATFTDTATHDAKDAIEFVKETGLFKGTTATTFNPNGSITRAQMATVVARWLAENGEVDSSQAKAFKDVSKNHWAAEAIAKVNILGIMKGTSATTFNPEGALTRAQAVKVLNQLFKRKVQASEHTSLFKDVTSTHWAFDDIQAAAK
ncbi:InlB B-repeat-containing protein [Lysinibacillus piscis]|uniref:InlB B-repeat-containing protein n=1 Tax=Lysinibacillus piscis TaxID=2518931 RepID=UPI002230739F|nr:InlB B-repeat-containing protein [Lysinibacillus sp. KH24]